MAGRDIGDLDCEAFHEGTPGDAGADETCETDGHYRCDECVFRATCDGGCGERPMYCACHHCDECGERKDRCRCPALRAQGNDAFARRMRAKRLARELPDFPKARLPIMANPMDSPEWAKPWDEWSREYLGQPQLRKNIPEDSLFTRRMSAKRSSFALLPQIYSVKDRERKS